MIRSKFLMLSLSLCALGCQKESAAPLSEREQSLPELEKVTEIRKYWHWDYVSDIKAFKINSKAPKSKEGMLSAERRQAGGIVSDTKFLNSSRLPIDGIKLTEIQCRKLHSCVYSAIGDNVVNVEEANWSVFHPSHAFLFYDQGGHIIGGIDLSLDNGSYCGWPTGFLTGWDLAELGALIRELDINE